MSQDKLTLAEIEADERLSEINQTVNHLIDLCNIEPVGHLIFSLTLKSKDADNILMSAYVGDSIAQINQLNMLIEREPQFMSDLTNLLDYRVRDQMAKCKTTGNKSADELFAEIDANTKAN